MVVQPRAYTVGASDPLASRDVGAWRSVFRAKGMFNMVGSSAFAVAPLVSRRAAKLMGADTPGSRMYLHIFLSHSVWFGAMYWWMARDPARHRAIVYLSIPIDITWMSVVLANYKAGNIPAPLTLPALSDGLMAVLFTTFLLRFPDTADQAV